MSKVINSYVVDWVVRGEFHEDTQYFDTIYFVMVELEDGRTMCQNHSFNDRDDYREEVSAKDQACRLVARVEDRGYINEDHWYFHDFFSHSLEARLDIEAEYENYARHGQMDQMTNQWFAGGHA